MNNFCFGLEGHQPDQEVDVFNGTLSSWHIVRSFLPQPSSLKVPGLVFQETVGLSHALKLLEQLAQNAVGARAHLQAKFRRLMSDESVPMMR